MKHFMLTTALATVTAFGAMAQTASEQSATGEGAQTSVPAFLASDFTGKNLYTLDTDEARMLSDRQRDQRAGQTGGTQAGDAGMSAADSDRMRWTNSETFMADRDSWNNIGSIDDIVMTMDGEIRGVLLDVGGFLGFGARTVMVDIEDLHFVSEEGVPRGIDDFFVVSAMSRDQLENLPEWDGTRLDTGFDARSSRQQDGSMGAATGQQQAGMGQQQEGTGQQQQATRGDMDRTDGAVFGNDHRMLEAEERTVDRLMGADVYDAHGENIGSVQDVMLDNDNRIDSVLVDVGGFLGIGAHTVMLPIQDAQIGWSDRDDDVRVQVTMTADQLENMPAFGG